MIMGINSRRQLAEAENIMRQRILNKLMDDGVTIMDPASTFIEKGVEIGQDTVIYPYTWLEGTTKIGEDCQIGPNVRLTNVRIGNTAELQFVYGHDCEVQDNVVIGPYVHLRPDTVIGDNVKIGNFVEVKILMLVLAASCRISVISVTVISAVLSILAVDVSL